MDFKVAIQNLDSIRSSFDDVEESQLIIDLINGRETPLGIAQAIIQQKGSKDATFEHFEKCKK